MRTLDLINQSEENRNKPQTAVNPLAAPKPAEGTSMEEARMGVDSEGQPIKTYEETSSPLYDAGIKLGSLGNTEAALKGKSPITTPEYERFRNEVIGAQQFGVETEEQRKARERRDFIKQGLTGFTEGLSALANLYYTAKGAPSQQLKSNMPELQKRLYQERIDRDKKLENFRAWQRAKAERDEERAYQEEREAARIAREDSIRENERKYREKKDAQAQANWEKTFNYNVEQDKLNREEKARQQEEAKKQFWANHGLQKERINAKNTSSSSSSSVMHGKNGTSILNTPNGFMDVDWKKVDPIAKNQLYNTVPEEIREKYPLKDELGEYNEKYATSQMNAAIAEAAVTDERIAKWLIDSKAASFQQQPESNPIHSNTRQSGNNGGGAVTDYSKYKTTGATDYSNFKVGGSNNGGTPSGGETKQSSSVNANPVATDSTTTNTQQGNIFESLSAKYSKEDADYAAQTEAKRQRKISNMEGELSETRNSINQYKKELDELNNMEMLNPRNFAGSRMREVQDAVNKTVKRKKYLRNQIKELEAKEKRLNKEYMLLYPYKK